MPLPLIGLRLPNDLHDAVLGEAAKEQEPVQQTIRRALAQYFGVADPGFLKRGWPEGKPWHGSAKKRKRRANRS